MWKYLKRMITIIFLVLLAPISCITYPIDKIGDGKAQAFNTWLQEFIYNVIIQPFHLLIYIVLVSSAIDLANSNIIYTICCFSVIIPAEKFIKQMFGFRDQLGSPLGTFAGGALFSKVLDSFKSGKTTSDGGKGGNSGGSKDDEERELPPNNKEIDEPEDVYSDDDSGGLDDPSGPNNPDESTPKLESSSGEQSEIADGSDENIEGEQSEIADGSDENIEGDPSDSEAGSAIDDGKPDEIGEGDGAPKENETPDNGEGGQGEGSKLNANGSANKKQKKKNGRLNRLTNKGTMRVKRYLQRTYGSTTVAGVAKGVGIRALKATGRGVYRTGKGVVRGTIKGATTLGLGLAAGTMSMMLGGKFSNGAVTGAALGAKVGGGITNQLDKVTSGVEKLATNAARDFTYSDEQLDERDFKKNNDNIRLAQRNFANRHDGQQPNRRELKDELDKMYEMKQHGIDEDYFNRTLSQYEDYLKDGMDEKDAFDTAMSSAIDAQEYKAADFRDSKKVAQIYEEKMATLRNSAEMRGKKLDEIKASERVSKVLLGAANMKGVKGVKIPSLSSEKIKIRIGSKVTNKIAEGYKNESDLIQSIAESAMQSISGNATLEKIDVAVEAEIGKFEKYLNNKGAQTAVANLNGNARNHEMAMRYNVKLKRGIEDEKTVSEIRDLEGKLGKKNTELADKLSRKLSSPQFKKEEVTREELVKEITDKFTREANEAVNNNGSIDKTVNNNSSIDKKTAESIVDLAGKYSGINFKIT